MNNYWLLRNEDLIIYTSALVPTFGRGNVLSVFLFGGNLRIKPPLHELPLPKEKLLHSIFTSTLSAQKLNMASQSRQAVGVFLDRQHIELALDALKAANFPMQNVSVVTQHLDPEDKAIATADTTVQSQAQFTSQQTTQKISEGALTGGSLGGAAGFLMSGLAILAVPGLGSIAVAGMGLATGAFYGALSGGLIKAGIGSETSPVGGVSTLGNQVQHYTERLAQGQYLIVVEGADDEIDRAGTMLKTQGVEDWTIFDPV